MDEDNPLINTMAMLGGRVAAEFERQVEQDDLHESTVCTAHIDFPEEDVRIAVTVSLQVSRIDQVAEAEQEGGDLATAQIAGSA